MKRIIQSLLAITLVVPTACYANNQQNSDPFMLRVAKKGDLELSCKQLVDEALLMREIITTTQTIKNDASFNSTAVTAIGAVGSFLTSTMTAGLSLAAAGLVASNEVGQNEDSADNVQDIARQRRALISGIYQAKSCPQGNMHSALSDEKAPIIYGKSNQMDTILARTIEPAAGQDIAISYND